MRNAATLAASRPVRQPTNSGDPCSVGMSAVSMMSLMPSGMPSISDKSPDARFKRLQTGEAAFEIFAWRVAAGREICSGGKEWNRLRDCHCCTP